MLISAYSYAQRIDTAKGGTIITITNNINMTAGGELQKASRHFYTGAIVMMGSAVAGSSLLLGEDPQLEIGVGIAGLGAAIGLGFMIESQIHLKRAGIILDRNGIGIAYKF